MPASSASESRRVPAGPGPRAASSQASFATESVGADDVPQLRQRLAGLALHRAERATEEVGGLLLRHVLEVTEHEHRALSLRQRGQRPSYGQEVVDAFG